MDKYTHIIGIDEAGRGPLAGPVVVGGVRVRKGHPTSLLAGIRDSKQLTANQREAWFERLTAHPDIEWQVAVISPKTIDSINIARATHRGAANVYRWLARGVSCHALLDGSLKLPAGASYEVIIKGDEKIPVISAASVIAKVWRDRLMRRLDKKYPEYGFAVHKGYGTSKHIQMLRLHGPSDVHRRSFVRNFL